LVYFSSVSFFVLLGFDQISQLAIAALPQPLILFSSFPFSVCQRCQFFLCQAEAEEGREGGLHRISSTVEEPHKTPAVFPYLCSTMHYFPDEGIPV
jgi:hypothetical protein